MKKNNLIKRFLYLSFLCFLGLYIYSKTGYYEVRLNQKKNLTEKQMALFEKDIAKGIAIDINDYLPKREDYSNYISRGAYKTTKLLNKFISHNIESIWKVIKTLFIN